MAKKRGIIVQVRVPFCVKDDALSRDGMILGWNSARMACYLDALVAEIEANAGQFDDYAVRAVQLSGGVASNAGAGVARIMRALRNSCNVVDDVLVTMRSSIANVSGATMPFFRRAGVTRFDFEMLSLNPVDFTRLNRVDNLNDFPLICDYFLHSYANDTLGLVLAFGYAPRKDEDVALNVRRTALAAARSHAVHVKLEQVGPALAAEPHEVMLQLNEMRDVLVEHGFSEYLPLCFARAGKKDAFLLLGSDGAEQLGFGLGAVTRLDGVESENVHDLNLYCSASADYAAITEEVRKVDGPQTLFDEES